MTSLITGGCGFIGSHMAQKLKDCVIIDNFSTCGVESIAMAEETGHEIVKGDICNKKLLDEVLSSGITKVYHLAAVPRVARSVVDPVLANKNVDGTVTLFKACVDNGIRDIVYASSSSVYGEGNEVRTEKIQPKPLNPYAVSKLAGEYYAQVFNELYGMRIASLRYFNVYGYGQEDKSEYACVIPKFIALARKAKPITIYGNGKQTRYFTYINDVVDANIKAMGNTGIYNICSDTPISILDLAKRIKDKTRSISDIKFLPKRKGDMNKVVASNKLAKKKLDWQPKYIIQEGLEELWTQVKGY